MFLNSALWSQEKYFIAFLATEEGPVGHAFVAFGRESEAQQMSISAGAWGLYPASSTSGAKSLVLGTVPGKLVDDFKRNSDVSLVLQVSKEEYELAMSIKELYAASNSYELLKNDCLKFLIDIASCCSSLNLPERSGFENLPMAYLKKLKQLNP